MASQPTADNMRADEKPKFKKKKPFQRPKPELGSRELPKPKSLSTTPTPHTNDVLWLQAFVNEGDRGMVQVEGTEKFLADASGYVALVEREYEAIADCDKYIAKDVPPSAFAYYHHILWWYRIALMAKRRGEASHDQQRLIEFVDGYDIKLGAGAATYLSGMGDYVDTRGVNHHLYAQEPGPDGHFGLITEATHRDYETKIAPAISFNRILSDLEATPNDRNFRMPAGVLPDRPRPAQAAAAPQAGAAAPARRGGRGRGRPRVRRNELELLVDRREGADEAQQPQADLDGVEEPEEDESEEEEPEPPRPVHRPTANLLGWRTPFALNKNQHANVQKIIRDPDDVEFTNNRYRVHPRLFEFVFNRLREAKRYQLFDIPKNTTGSIAQQLAWTPEEAVIEPDVQYIHGQGRIIGSNNLAVRIVAAARVFCYRIIRNPIDGNNSWACLHWDRYANVPGNWSGNRNSYLVRGSRGLFEWTPFSTSIEDRNDAVTTFLNKFKARA